MAGPVTARVVGASARVSISTKPNAARGALTVAVPVHDIHPASRGSETPTASAGSDDGDDDDDVALLSLIEDDYEEGPPPKYEAPPPPPPKTRAQRFLSRAQRKRMRTS